MPYRLIWGKRHVLFNYSGNVTSADVIESNHLVYGDERFDNLRWQIVSFDAADSIDFSEEDVKRIAFMDHAAAQSNPRITVIFCGPPDLLQNAGITYAEATHENLWPILVVESEAEALETIETA